MSAEPSSRLSELSRVIHREVVLLALLSAVAAGGFGLTRWAAASNRALQGRDATAWFERGRLSSARGRTADAVVALEHAVSRRPGEWAYGKALAEAMMADGKIGGARQLLSRWRLLRPDDPDVNVQLARLEAAGGDVAAAVEYYESALHGRWTEPATTSRLDLRRELIRYELARGLTAAALAQTLVLAANVPDEPAAQLETGRLFLAAGDVARALERFVRTLRLDPRNVGARIGATQASFAVGDYAAALAHARGLTDQPSRDIARISASVLANDPLASRLSFGERERRLASAVDYARVQYGACRQRAPTVTPLAARTSIALVEALSAFRMELSAQRLRESPDVIEHGLRLVDQALQYVRQRCPPLDNRGDALVRVARLHGATE